MLGKTQWKDCRKQFGIAGSEVLFWLSQVMCVVVLTVANKQYWPRHCYFLHACSCSPHVVWVVLSCQGEGLWPNIAASVMNCIPNRCLSSHLWSLQWSVTSLQQLERYPCLAEVGGIANVVRIFSAKLVSILYISTELSASNLEWKWNSKWWK